jgi:hypothetical protein
MIRELQKFGQVYHCHDVFTDPQGFRYFDIGNAQFVKTGPGNICPAQIVALNPFDVRALPRANMAEAEAPKGFRWGLGGWF